MKKFISTIVVCGVMLSSGSAMCMSCEAAHWVGNGTNGYRYQYDDGSYAAKGWLKVGNNTYYIKKDGTRQTGWFTTTNGNTYYFNNKGVMMTGLCKINGYRYMFAEDGVMITGVYQKGNKTYYFSEDGVLYQIVTTKVTKRVETTTYTTTVVEVEDMNGNITREDRGTTVDTQVEYIN